MAPPRPTQLIETPEALAELMPRLAAESALALDTESNSFHAYFERVCLVQVSTREADYALDPLKVELGPALRSLFATPGLELVMHAADYDVRTLKRDFGVRFPRLFDTMLAAKVLGSRELGLAALVRQEFQVVLAKEHQRSDWGRRPLSAEQLAYAHTDTRYLLPLRDRLAERLAQEGRAAAAQKLFQRQTTCEPKPKRFDPEGYRKIRGVRSLESGAREVVRALYLLREERAQAANRPPFKVYGDDAILEMVKKLPRSCEELAKVKGVGISTVRRDGEAIVAALASALAHS